MSKIKFFLVGLLGFASAVHCETMLVIGNSLAGHARADSLGWFVNHGMAASYEEVDYCHLLKAKLENATGKTFDVVITRVVNEAVIGTLPNNLPEKADVVLLQIGDNYKSKLEHDEAVRRYRALLAGLKSRYPESAMVSVSPWKCSGTELMREGAQAEGVPFASIIPLGRNSAMDAKGFNAWAVNWHPGDRAMELIADTIWEKLSPIVMKERTQATLTGVIPEVQEARLVEGAEFLLLKGMAFHAPEKASMPMHVLLDDIVDECHRRFGIKLDVAYDMPGEDCLVLGGEDAGEPMQFDLPQKGYDGYGICVRDKSIVIRAAFDQNGIYYGLQTLRQLLDGRGAAPSCDIRDWAEQKWRIAYMGLGDFELLFSKFSRLKINMVIIESYWNGHQNWWYRPGGKNLEAAMKCIETAKKYNLEVVPLVQGGGWAYGVADRNPHLCEGVWVKDEQAEIAEGHVVLKHANVIRTKAQPIIVRSADGNVTYVEGTDYEVVPGVTVRRFDEKNKPWELKAIAGGRLADGVKISIDYNYVPFSPYQSPYCPSDPETYELLSEVLENVVKIYNPRFIHIGHDEVIRRNTDRRCLERGLSRNELASEDLNWWYKKLKELNPNIQIMVWDDMLRKGIEEGKLLSMIPEDIIICPWVYQVTANDKKEIDSRVDWFIGENHRSTIGTSSGYYPLNSVMWKDSLQRFKDEQCNWGMMFSHWGESNLLWASLPFAAECMWSPNRPDSEYLKTMISCDDQLRRYINNGMRPTLEYEYLRSAFAQDVNRGGNSVAAMRKTLVSVENELMKHRMPGFGGTDNPLKESIIGQGRRLVKLYEAMVLARNLPLSKDATDGRRYFALLDELFPGRIAEWNSARAKFTSEGVLLDAETVFGVAINPVKSLDNGIPVAVLPAKVSDILGRRSIEFDSTIRLCQIVINNAKPGLYSIAGVTADGKAVELGKPMVGDNGKAVVIVDNVPVKSIGIVSTESMSMIQGDFLCHAVKETPVYNPEGMKADCFVNNKGSIAKLQTSATLKCTETELLVSFTVTESKDRAPETLGGAVYDDDCIQFFLREKKGSKEFLHVIVNCAGKVLVLNQNGRSGELPECKAVVEKLDGNSWKADISIPVSALSGKPDDWSVNFTRNSRSGELSSYVILPAGAAFWFLQPDVFVGK